jgi:hypothetical protein
MNRTAVALLAAIESLVAAAIGLGIAIVPLTVLWAVKYNMTIGWSVFWRAACDLWLLGHGVDLHIALDTKTATALGLPGAAAPFTITIAALGCALLVVILGIRIGRRAALTDYPVTAAVAALVVYGIVAAMATLSAQASVVRPSVPQGVFIPVFVFAIGVVGGVVAGLVVEPPGAVTGIERSLRERIDALPEQARRAIGASLRGGVAAVALTLCAAAVLVAVALAVHFSAVVGLYERLQTGVVGGATLTLGQLAFLPNLVIWGAAWLVGPGFAIGAGSSVSPLGTQLGPIPSVPVLGALPHGSSAFGFLGILVPVLAGLAAALLVTVRDRGTSPAPMSIGNAVVSGIGIGIVAGFLLALGSWWSAGSIGPGRLAEAGPDLWRVGLFAAVETGIAAVVGMLAGSRFRDAGGVASDR